MFCQCASVTDETFSVSTIQEQTASKSIGPCCATRAASASKPRAIEAGSARSMASTSAAPLGVGAAWVKSMATTSQPSAVSRLTVAAPIPPKAPTTTARRTRGVLFASDMVRFSLLGSGWFRCWRLFGSPGLFGRLNDADILRDHALVLLQ